MDIAALGFRIDSRDVVTAKRNLDALPGSARRVETASEKLARTMQRDWMMIRRVVGGAIFLGVLRQLQQTADGYANVQAKLRLVTADQLQLARATESVFQVSQRTYASMESTAQLVARTTRALASNGEAQDVALQKSLALGEAINNAFLVSGATAQESHNAIIQLTQGI